MLIKTVTSDVKMNDMIASSKNSNAAVTAALMFAVLFVVLLQPYILVSLLECRVCDFLAMAISALPRAKVYSTLVNKIL